MRFQYRPEHTCSQLITFDLEGDKVYNVQFMGGCDGNLKAIPKLVDGMTVFQIEEKLAGITCGRRPTSCTDQLAKAVRMALSAKDNQKTQEEILL